MEKGEQPRGLNILCIDGGGVRGLSSLLLLSEIMNRLRDLEGANQPLNVLEYFDIIAGTGTGGVSAGMLGRLRMSLDEAIKAYARLVKDVFSEKKVTSTGGGATYKGARLREALKLMVREATGNADEPMKGGEREMQECKTMVFAMSKHNMNASIPVMFRSYEAPANSGPDCTIWEALYATMAHPNLFKPIEIDDGIIQQSFVGGELGCSNPIAHVLAEARRLYPDRHVSCVLSIGAGHPRTIFIPGPTSTQRILRTEDAVAMKNMATDSERVAEEMAARFQDTTGVYYRFNVDQGMQNMEAGDWERLSEVVAHTRAYTTKVDTTRGLDHAVQAIEERRRAISVANLDGRIQVPFGEQTPNIKRCPAPTSVYTGREDQIKQVGTCITGGADERRVCVVYGLGGAGKTQLSLKTIELNRDSWTHVLYMDTSSKEAVETGLVDFAKAKGIGNTYEDTLKWLESRRESWLLVFDNADHPSLNIHKYFPGGNHGSILITTRLLDLAVYARGPGSVCHISTMDPKDSLALLLKVARIPDQGADESELEAANALLKDFGYLALAIVHAGAYIGHLPHMSISKYRELFLAQRQRMLDQYAKLRVKFDEYGQSVYTTWKMCYDLLEENSGSRQMLWLIAYLHHDSITEAIFERAAHNIQTYEPEFPPAEGEQAACDYVRDYLGRFLDSEGGWDTLKFSEAIGELASYSLVDFDRVNLAYSIHVLVQKWARTIITQPPDFALDCTATLLAQSASWDNSAGSYDFKSSLVLHVGELLSETRGEISANHSDRFAAVFRAMGQWKREEAMELHVEESRRRLLGAEHPSTLTSTNTLAWAYRNQGRWDEAESLQMQVLNARKRVLGEEHPDTLVSMHNLAIMYQDQGRLDEAEPLQLRVLNARKRILGEEHPETLIGMNNLAWTYRERGRWDEAESLQAQVLNARKRVLGEEHPDTLSSVHDLAWTYQNQGRINEAESLQLRALNARKRILGEEHPETLTGMNNLATMYQDQGRFYEAEPLQLRVLNARKRILGEEHPETLTGMNNLAWTYREQGRWDEAELLQVQVLDARKRILGEEHPNTLSSANALAWTYQNQGRINEAEPLQLRVLNARKRILGEEHPDTLRSMGNLATMYQDQGRFDEAESLQVQDLDARKRILGEEHPETLIAMSNLAWTYRERGRYNEAESLQSQALNAQKRVLGEEHPDTLSTVNNLAVTYRRQGRWDEAESLQAQVLNVRERLLGEEHPDTLVSMNDLAITYQDQGRFDAAEPLQLRVLNARVRILGEEHPETLIGMANLSRTYRNQGRWDETESLQAQVLNARKRVLGEEHPDTLKTMNVLAVTYQYQGRFDEAERLQVQVLNTFKRVLGETDPQTLIGMNNLAWTYREQGRFEEAEALFIRSFDAQVRTIGDQHPNTLQTKQYLDSTRALRATAEDDALGPVDGEVVEQSNDQPSQPPQSSDPVAQSLHVTSKFISPSHAHFALLMFLFLPAIVALAAYMYFSR